MGSDITTKDGLKPRIDQHLRDLEARLDINSWISRIHIEETEANYEALSALVKDWPKLSKKSTPRWYEKKMFDWGFVNNRYFIRKREKLLQPYVKKYQASKGKETYAQGEKLHLFCEINKRLTDLPMQINFYGFIERYLELTGQ